MTPATKRLIEELADVPRGKDMKMTRRHKRATSTMKPGNKRLKGHFQSPATRKKIAETLKKIKADAKNDLIRQYRESGRKPEEIAFALDMTVAAVRCRLYRMENAT